jgi:hypothetical protein
MQFCSIHDFSFVSVHAISFIQYMLSAFIQCMLSALFITCYHPYLVFQLNESTVLVSPLSLEKDEI